MTPVVLAIGGSDSSGGAGIQADLRTIGSFSGDGSGIRGCSAITALTAQNPGEVTRIEPVSLAQLEAEIRAVFAYYDVKAVKTGMLYDTERIGLVADLMQELHSGKPLVVDPVMVSSSGSKLLEDSSIEILRERLFPLATLITPNIPEAEALLGGNEEVDACRLAERFSVPVLLKGGHLRSDTIIDVLCVDGEKVIFPHASRKLDAEAVHGTGCRLASATAARLARGDSLAEAVGGAIRWLQESLAEQLT